MYLLVESDRFAMLAFACDCCCRHDLVTCDKIP